MEDINLKIERFKVNSGGYHIILTAECNDDFSNVFPFPNHIHMFNEKDVKTFIDKLTLDGEDKKSKQVSFYIPEIPTYLLYVEDVIVPMIKQHIININTNNKKIESYIKLYK